MTEFFSMGNYGAYVWSSFGITLAVVIICVLQGRSRHKSVLVEIKRRIHASESES